MDRRKIEGFRRKIRTCLDEDNYSDWLDCLAYLKQYGEDIVEGKEDDIDNIFIKTEKGVDIYEKVNLYTLGGFRKLLIEKSGCANKNELMKRSYLVMAHDDLDSFMLYIEWDRPTKDKFWLPRRKKLLHICHALQRLEDGKLDELFLSQPPRTGKSTLILFFLLWVMLRDSEKSNLYCSYSDGVCLVFYNGLLEVLSDPYTYLWKDVFPDAKVAGTNANEHLLNLDRPKRYATLTSRSLYGALNGSCDASGYIIADDLISGIEEAMNNERLNHAWFKVENNLLARDANGSAKLLWIGTRWSLRDCIARREDIVKNEAAFKGRRYEVINVPALDENDHSNFEYDYGKGFTSEYYVQRRASFERNNDMASWLAQYQGEPIEREGVVFNPEDLRYFNGILPDGEPDRIFMVCDPAWGGGDYVAAPVCVQYGNDIFVPSVVYNNKEKDITIPLITQKCVKFNVSAMYVEGTRVTKTYGNEIDESLRKMNHAINMQISTSHIGSGVAKIDRILAHAPEIRERMIFLTEEKRDGEYRSFMQNLFRFTITSSKKQHDDAPDSLAMAIAFISGLPSRLTIEKRVF